MGVIRVRPHFLYALPYASLIALCILLISSAPAQARTMLPHAGPTMQVSAGFSSRYRDGDWVPLYITLHNDGPDFTGTVSVNFQQASVNSVSEPASRYQQTVSLPNGAQKQVIMYVPVSLGTQGSTQTLTVDLLDSNGHRVASQVTTLRSLGINDMLVGVLSDQSTSISALGQVSQPNQTASVYEEPLNATSMPDNTAALQNFDLIVMDYFTTSSLSNDQLTALDNWVSQGGNLVIAGGPEWRRTLTGLPNNLTPVNVTGTSMLPAGTGLLPVGGPGSDIAGQNAAAMAPAPLLVSDATPDANSNVLQAAGQVPLIVEAQHNQGSVYYLAFDPSLNPLANWSNAPDLWRGLLIRAVGDRFLDASQNPSAYSSLYTTSRSVSPSSGNWQSVLQTLFPNVFPAMWLILMLLVGYVVILGPVRLVVVRIAKKRTWSWRIVLVTIALFSVLSYSLATLQKGTSVVGSSISITQLGAVNNNVSSAHVTTYVGVFVPNQGNFVVHLPANNFVQPLGNGNNMYMGPGPTNYTSTQTAITTTSNGTDANLQGVNIWTLQSLVSSYDTQTKGGIISHLQMQNNILEGTITNSLPYGLEDAYILIGQQPINVGNLNAGQTKQISIPVYGGTLSSNNASLADQIASSHGLSVPYIPEASGNSSLKNDYERHAAVLATMSGENSLYCGNGNFCYQPALTSGTAGKVIVNGRAILTTSGQDPLLLPNAPATFIGWVANNANTANPIVVNGSSVNGTQESLVQAPLDISLSGAVNLPVNFVNGQLTDVQSQGSNIQTQFPGVYTLSTGSLTFEFASPALRDIDTNTLTFTENTSLVSGLGNAGGTSNNNLNTPGDFSHVQIYLYNWQTHKWDEVTFNQSALTVNNAQAYTSTDGRILMQFSNQDSTQGTTLLTRPVLQLQGQISH
ncbi:MAG TPA: hypothetical protein VH593_33825 [Ktedonobacteraceae bacterium]